MEPDFSMVGNLPLPEGLLKLIETGRWPRTHEEELQQNIRPLVSKERVRSFAQDQERIYLVRPAFSTVTERIAAHEGEFWSRFGAIEQISPDSSIFIGDFGLGSDSPILLDYRKDRLNPSVIRLKWDHGEGQRNQRQLCADSFDAFSDLLGL
jgi:hypothetical protein